jgi:hypothetical protein
MPLSFEARAAILRAGFPVLSYPPRHWVDRDSGRSAHAIISDVLAREAAGALRLRRLQRRAGDQVARSHRNPT